MMAVMKHALLVLTLALTACTDHQDRERSLTALVGQPEAELVRQMGVPNRSYETAGRKFVAYTQRQTVYFGASPFFGYGYGYFGPGAYTGFPAEVVERRCETTFEIGTGRVLSWTDRGNSCP